MNPAPPRRGLLDTALLLAARGGDAAAYNFVMRVLVYHLIDMSQATALALLAASPDEDDRASLRVFLKNNQVHSLTALIARRAVALLDRLPPPSPLTADDAFVAATALARKLPLYTLDPGRFAAVTGLTAVRPY